MTNQKTDSYSFNKNRSIKQIPEPIKPKSLLQILWRSRWIILFTTVLAVTATAVYLSKEIPIFQSTSTIYVEQIGPRIISEMEEGVMMKSNNYLYTQAVLLKSEPILSAIFNDPNIVQMKTFNMVDNPVNYLKNDLDVTVGSMDEIISISFESPYPKEAAQIVNAIVQSYINFHISQKRSTAADVLKILQSQKEKRNKEIVEKLNEMMEFKERNPALAFENNILQRLERLSTDLTEAQLAAIEKKSAFDSTKKLIGDPNSLRQFIETQLAEGAYGPMSSERTELKSKLEQLQRQKIDLLRQLTTDHPAVEILENEIAYIKNQIATLDTEFVQTRLAIEEQEYLNAKDMENQIQKHFEEQRLQALALNEQLAQYTILQSEYEQMKKDWELINDRIEDVNVSEDTGALNINVLETARAANKPSDSDHIRFLSFALVIGFMFGSGLAILRDWKDQKIHSPEEISLTLGLPILGMIPSMPKRESIVTRGQKVHLEPDCPAAEAYRTIRTAIFFGAPNKKAKTILVTSAREFEGKTTLASNLAIAMAQTGQNTLLLDADFRNPMQYKVFETDNKNGIVSLLSGTTTLENAIHSTEIEGLELLPCKTQLINPSEIINSENFAKLIELLSSRYDRVIIDSPPVVPVTDSQILAAICDVSILIIRAEKTTRKMSQLARNGLQSVRANVLGLVVNDVPKKSQYGYYENLHKYYGYRSTSQKRGGN